jgi:SAM-dependent methyltransferase
MNTCRICHTQGDHPLFHPKEVILGTREEFEYFKCKNCGCLQITDIPEDLGQYYPQHYLSFKNYAKILKNKPRRYLDSKRVSYNFGKFSIIGWLGKYVAKPLDYLNWMNISGCKPDDNVLDIGCGNGNLLLRMTTGGITHCEGIDPFVSQDIEYPNGLKIFKASIQDYIKTCDKKYKLIMMNHALEHMTDPHEVIESAAQLLDNDGSMLIRIPIVDSLAWNMYKEYWGNFDAPRHIHLFNPNSLAVLLNAHNLTIYETLYESNPAQFIWSELYKRGYTAADKIKPVDVLGKAKITEYKNLSKKVQVEQRADCAAFFVRFAK